MSGPVCDVNFADVAILLHFDAYNGATAFIDSSSNNVTATRSATLDTSVYKFGPGSANWVLAENQQVYWPIGTGAGSMPDCISAGDFTIEGWFLTTDNTFVGYLFNIGPSNQVTMTQQGSYVNALVFGNLISPFPSFVNNTWNHVALVMHAGQVVIYINGVAQNAPVACTQTPVAGFNFQLGNGTGSGYSWVGNIDEFQISAYARYTQNFAPPTGPNLGACMPTCDLGWSDVSLLLNFDGANGSTTFTDLSANALTMTAIGAPVTVDTSAPKFGTGAG
jgi:hypothetical protein